MRTRTHLLLLVTMSLVGGTLGSLVAVAATPGTADACSIAGPHAGVVPRGNLQPGQKIEIVGRSFVDIRFHEPRPAVVAPPDSDIAVLPPLCDFDVYPIASINVTWRGNVSRLLGVVAGPDFSLTAVVPADAARGPATITAGPVTLAVHVGPEIEPPPPPCPLYATLPAPETDFASGFPPRCPEPCVDYAHTTDAGPDHEYPWDCPDPCGRSAVNPGAAASDTAAVWCPPPDPCPVYATGDAVVSPEAAVWCPDPCGRIGGGTAAVWCPPPDPCPVYATGEAVSPEAAVWCPDPCGRVANETAAVWCPPPCLDYANDAVSFDCALPMPATAGDAVGDTATDDTVFETHTAPAAAASSTTAASVAAVAATPSSSAVAAVAYRVMAMVRTMMATFTI